MDRSMSNEDDACRFESAGPRRKHSNWDFPETKRAILSCLVKGVYTLQYDNVKRYTNDRALAPPWWKSHNYELIDEIWGKDNTMINGAVFKWNSNHPKHPRTPKVILAFRGTTSLQLKFDYASLKSDYTSLKSDYASLKSDYAVDWKLMNQKLHKTSRFTAAYNSLRKAVDSYGCKNVCVTGHSLGAALALSAAREMASEGVFIEAHLFNPPFLSSVATLKTVLGAGAYSGLLDLYTVTKAGLVKLMGDKNSRRQSKAAFVALGSWYPDMYVHEKDPICSGFLEHFMKEYVMPNESIRGVLFPSSAKPHHLIPSARLHVPKDKVPGVSTREAHSLTQWWSDELLVDVRHINLTRHNNPPA